MEAELLARFLAGEASADDQRRIERWAADDAAAGRELAALRGAWETRMPPGTWDVDRAWKRVLVAIDRPRPAVLPFQRRRPWLAIAAAAVLLVAAGIWWLRPGAPPPTIWQTAAGEQRPVTLSDGSRLVLAPASRIELGDGFGSDGREVRLDGRAWFAVVHDEARPFRVITPGAVIEDLGTEFEVVARGGGSPVQVAVIEGSVAVEQPGRPRVRLGPRDVVTLSPAGAPAVEHDAPVERLAGWRRGVLNFDNTTLEVIAGELGRWYGVEVAFADAALARRTLSVGFKTDDLDEVVTVLETALDIEVARSPNRLVLRAKVPR